jgi:hypothetical protein
VPVAMDELVNLDAGANGGGALLDTEEIDYGDE